MRAPRLRIGVLADGSNPVDLSLELSAVGHMVETVSGVEEIGNCELVVIAVADGQLEATVQQLAAFSRRGQMFLHTSLMHGIQVMDPLETSGAIVMAAHPLGADRWVVAAPDELGETIVGLLVGELGGSTIRVEDARRTQLAAAVTYMGYIRTLVQDAEIFLNTFVTDAEATGEIVQGAADRFVPMPKLDDLMGQYASIEDPGRQRLFRDLSRRQAEISRAQDIELWAIQKEDRG